MFYVILHLCDRFVIVDCVAFVHTRQWATVTKALGTSSAAVLFEPSIKVACHTRVNGASCRLYHVKTPNFALVDTQWHQFICWHCVCVCARLTIYLHDVHSCG